MRAVLLSILFLAVPALAQAQYYGKPGDRSKTWEWSIAGIYQDAESTGNVGGSNLDIDSAWGLGVSFGYHLNSKLMLGVDLEWLKPDYQATLVNENDLNDVTTINHDFFQFNGRFKGVFHLMDGPFTPYLEAGLGWTYFDSNVIDGPPITGCWWHPLWGYVCSNYYSTYTETSFSYGGALGLRYKLQSGMTLKLSYNTYSIDGSGSSPDPTLSAARLELAWGF